MTLCTIVAVADSHNLNLGSTYGTLPLDDIADFGAHHRRSERRCPTDTVGGDVGFVIADDVENLALIGFVPDRDRCAKMHLVTRLTGGFFKFPALRLRSVITDLRAWIS